MRFKVLLSSGFLLLLFFGCKTESKCQSDNWPNWRGVNADGVSSTGTPPTEWSEEKNVKWKTPIPGKGVGTPVSWGDQIFLTSAIELDQKAAKEVIKKLKKKTPGMAKIMGYSKTTEQFIQFVVHSINKNNGEIVWTKVVREQYPHEGINVNGSWASASCTTDGEFVIASFGSYGIYCFDLQGNLIWERDLGDMSIDMTFGEGTSPVLYQDKLIILWDHEGQSKLYVLDKRTGLTQWEKDREEGTTWSTPLVKKVDGQAQIIVAGYAKSMGYDLNNGDVVWELKGLGQGIIPSPVSNGQKYFLMTGYGKVKILQAVNLQNAHGDLENTDVVAWTTTSSTSYVPSPLLANGKLYYLKGSRAQLSCVDATTGSVHYEAESLEGLKGTYASPVYANGKIYILGRKGSCAVIEEGVSFKVISKNKLDDSFDASPVIIGKDLLLRGFKNLYCISNQ